MKRILDDWRVWLLASLTLGLAPFSPEPHIVGKLRWIAGGANGMAAMDWFDTVLHGTPFVLLLRAVILQLVKRVKSGTKHVPMKALLLAVVALSAISCNKNTVSPDETSRKQVSSHEEWAYTGPMSPEHWAELDPEYIKCAEGLHQSPIDIETHIATELDGNLEFEYRSTRVNLVNDGHTVQARPRQDNVLYVLGREWHLVQIHFHDPSEHHIDGIIYPMEVHLVHKGLDDKLAVVAIMVKEGPKNDYMQTIWDSIPQTSGAHVMTDAKVDMPRLIPLDGTVYHYQGSLTTPPCSEGVEWFVLSQPMELSKAQITKFKVLYPGNNRPVQEHPVEVDVLN